MPLTHCLQLREVLHNPLQLRMVKPRHFDYLCQQNYHHFQDLLISLWALLSQIAEHVLFYVHFFFHGYLLPVRSEQLFHGWCGEKLHISGIRVFHKIPQHRQILDVLSELLQRLIRLLLGLLRRTTSCCSIESITITLEDLHLLLRIIWLRLKIGVCLLLHFYA